MVMFVENYRTPVYKGCERLGTCTSKAYFFVIRLKITKYRLNEQTGSNIRLNSSVVYKSYKNVVKSIQWCEAVV